MNVEANIEAVRSGFENYRENGPAVLKDLFHDDCVIYSYGPKLEPFPFTGEWHGHEGLSQYMDAIWSNYQPERLEQIEVVGTEDLVLVQGLHTWRHRKLDETFTTRKAEIFRIKDLKVAEFREFWDPSEALQKFS